MSNSPIYPHALTDRTIRLLTVEPGDLETPLQCTLQETHLDMTPISYYALSYCWGASHSPVQIICNSHSLLITPNLHSALLEYRRRRTNVPLWVDAICIDQSNIPERTSQVRMMQKIYSKAECVVVWLGEKDVTDRTALELLKAVHGLWATSTGIPFLSIDQLLSIGQEALHIDACVASELPQVYSDALAAFFLKPWFSRIWIVQELLSADEVVMWCGSSTLNEEFPVLEASTQWSKMINCTSRTMSGVTALKNVKSQEVSELKLTCAGVLWVIKYAKDKGTSNILYLLISTRYFDATDPRDKIFALVGLASDIDESFVDYSKSYEDVIRELSHMSLDGRIEATAGCVLDLWSFITRKEDDNITEPSWVVDWLRLKDSQYTPMMDAYPPTKLVIQRFPEIQFLKKGVKELICVRGTIVDAITHTIPFPGLYTQVPGPNLEPYQHAARFHDWFTHVENLLIPPGLEVRNLGLNDENAVYHPTGERLYDAFWRTLCCNSSFMYTFKCPADDSGYHAFRLLLTIQRLRHGIESTTKRWFWCIATVSVSALTYRYRKSNVVLGTIPLAFPLVSILCRLWNKFQDKFLEQIQIEQRDFDASHKKWAVERQFCLTEKGMMGLLPFAAKVGDSVGVFAGCRIPYILRASEDEYKIVGDAYLHGMMDGEGEKKEGEMLEIV